MLKKIASLLIIASGFLFSAKADTIVASSASNTTNNSGSPTLNISPNAGWATAVPGSNWVSFTESGDMSGSGYVSPANGTDYIFSQTFTLDGTATGGTLYVLADDTASVSLNGNLIYSAAIGSGVTDPDCASQPIGCVMNTEGIINLGSYLGDFNNSGPNTLSFQVYQEAGSSYGLDYYVDITTSTPTNTPESGTLLMLTFGLVGLFVAYRRNIAGDFTS